MNRPRLLLSLCLCALVASSSCTPRETPNLEPVQISLGLRPKPSCDISPVLYDTQCLAGVQLVVEPTGTSPKSESCRDLSAAERSPTLAALLTREEPVIATATLADRGTVVFKVRGIHDQGLPDDGTTPCDNAEQPQHWLFWGESAPVDLAALAAADGGTPTVNVNIPIDCRDCAGGCTSLGTASCPSRFPASYCVPFSPGFSCSRRCDTDDECFEGAIACDADTGRCDDTSGDPGTGFTGGFCFPCEGPADCDVGYTCVGAPGASDGLCVRDCPLNRCVAGATCQRLGADMVLFTGSAEQTDADAGPDVDAGGADSGAP
jgi:hypothetical protein